MSWRVLITAPYFIPVLPRFVEEITASDIVPVVVEPEERFDEERLLELVGDIDGTICGDDRYTEKVLRAAPRLKVISKWGTGIDSIDRAAAARLGIQVLNTPDAFSVPVSDTILGYMLIFARNLLAMDRQMKEGRWHKIPSTTLGERTLGIVGTGNVGRQVARKARAFGMKILGCDIREIAQEVLEESDITMVSLEELLREADFVSLNCDLNPTSHRLMNSRTLRLMKPTAILINTSRGPVVEEAALVTALEERWIAGAALDVFELEPLPATSGLRRFDNCLMAPHNSNSSPLAWERVHRNTLRNLVHGLNR